MLIPYLLGIRNGIEDEEGIVAAYNEMYELSNPNALIMIGPFDSIPMQENFGADSGTLLSLSGLAPKEKFVLETEMGLGGDNNYGFLRVINK